MPMAGAQRQSIDLANALIVDDSEGDALLAEMVLQEVSPGVVVRHVDNGGDALELLMTSGRSDSHDRSVDETFDLVLLDLSMPGLTGFDVLDSLADNEHFTTRVVVLTSSTREADRDRVATLRVAGATVGYVTKDTDFASFRRRLSAALGGPRLD